MVTPCIVLPNDHFVVIYTADLEITALYVQLVVRRC